MTPPVRDAATGQWVPVGPKFDDTDSWNAYRRDHPGRRYATAKHALSRRKLRRHELMSDPKDLE